MVRNTAHRSGRQGKNQTQECLRGLASFSCFMTYLTNVQIQTTHPLVTVFHRLAFNFQPVVLPTAALNIENKQWFWLEWNVMAIFHTGITLGSCFHFIFCLLNLAGKPILVIYMTQFNFFFILRNHLKGYQLAMGVRFYMAKSHSQCTQMKGNDHFCMLPETLG